MEKIYRDVGAVLAGKRSRSPRGVDIRGLSLYFREWVTRLSSKVLKVAMKKN